MHYRKHIATNLKYFRKLAGFTQEKLAEVINMEKGTISRIETRKGDSSLKTMYKIADALGVTVEILLKDHTNPIPFDSDKYERILAEFRVILKRNTREYEELAAEKPLTPYGREGVGEGV